MPQLLLRRLQPSTRLRAQAPHRCTRRVAPHRCTRCVAPRGAQRVASGAQYALPSNQAHRAPGTSTSVISVFYLHLCGEHAGPACLCECTRMEALGRRAEARRFGDPARSTLSVGGCGASERGLMSNTTDQKLEAATRRSPRHLLNSPCVYTQIACTLANAQFS